MLSKPFSSAHICREKAQSGDGDRGVIWTRKHWQIQHADVVLFHRDVIKRYRADLNRQNGWQTITNVQYAREDDVHYESSSCIEAVIEQHAHY